MQEVFCKNKQDLWRWLHKHHQEPQGVWLVYYKPSLKLGDLDKQSIIDYCLCFGWIDSVVGKVDDQKTKLRISPRNPKSKWSQVNKHNITRLIKAKQMQPAGLVSVSTAKRTGTWNALNDVEKLILPTDLRAALLKSQLLEHWENLSISNKRMYLETLLNSKKVETRQKNIKKVLAVLK